MTAGSVVRLPSAAGWHWRPLRDDEFMLAHPLILVVEGVDAATWLARARGWTTWSGGIVGVRSPAGTILGLFFHRVAPAASGPRLVVEAVRSLELLGRHHTLAAVLRAIHQMTASQGCQDAVIVSAGGAAGLLAEGMADVGPPLNFAPIAGGWRLELGGAAKVVPLRGAVPGSAPDDDPRPGR